MTYNCCKIFGISGDELKSAIYNSNTTDNLGWALILTERNVDSVFTATDCTAQESANQTEMNEKTSNTHGKYIQISKKKVISDL